MRIATCRLLVFVAVALGVAGANLGGCQSTPATVPTISSDEPPAQPDKTAPTNNDAHGRRATLWVKGLACPFCTYNVEKQLLRVAGVERVDVELATGKVIVNLSKTSPPGEEQLRNAIKNSGFTVDRIEMP